MPFYSPIKSLNFKTFHNNHPLFRSCSPLQVTAQLPLSANWVGWTFKKSRETMRSRRKILSNSRDTFSLTVICRVPLGTPSCGSRKHGIRDETTSITIIPFKNVETLKFNLQVMMNVPGETIENDNPIMMQQRNVSHGTQTDKPFDFQHKNATSGIAGMDELVYWLRDDWIVFSTFVLLLEISGFV